MIFEIIKNEVKSELCFARLDTFVAVIFDKVLQIGYDITTRRKYGYY